MDAVATKNKNRNMDKKAKRLQDPEIGPASLHILRADAGCIGRSVGGLAAK